MLRRLLVIALLGALTIASVDIATAGKRSFSRSASVKVTDCRVSDGGDTRSATFVGRVRAIRGSDRMAMRFTLLERFGDERRHPVAIPELRTWHYSKSGIRDFRYKQTVDGLQGGGNYHVRVNYRWYGADGQVLRRARRVSRACRQQGDLANLLPELPTFVPGDQGTVVYRVPVSNRGRETARNVAVELSIDGAAADVGQIDAIAPGETREVRIGGPVCQGGVRVVVDPADTVKERRESDNILKSGCPPPAL